MKNFDERQFNGLLEAVDYKEVIENLECVEFTDRDLVNIYKKLTGKTIHLNWWFVTNVIKPLTNSLLSQGVLSIKKNGKDQVYNLIKGKGAAIEALTPKKKELKNNASEQYLALPAKKAEVPKAVAPEKIEESNLVKIDGITINTIESAYNLKTDKDKIAFRRKFIASIVIFGHFFRQSLSSVKTSIISRSLEDYFKVTKYSLTQAVAEFNTAAIALGKYQWKIRRSGTTRGQKLEIDFSPRRAIRFLEEIGKVYYPKDAEISTIIDWSLGKIVLSLSNLEIKREEPAQVKEEQPKIQNGDKERFYVVSYMGYREFKERYQVSGREIMHADRFLIEIVKPSKETLDRIQSELRKGEEILL